MGHVAARHAAVSEDITEPISEDVTLTSSNEVVVEKSKRRDSAGASGSNSSSKSDIWERQREKEEKLVADIIDRVRRECEAQGAMVSRRGYSRRSTVMNTCN